MSLLWSLFSRIIRWYIFLFGPEGVCSHLFYSTILDIDRAVYLMLFSCFLIYIVLFIAGTTISYGMVSLAIFSLPPAVYPALVPDGTVIIVA